MVEMNYDMLNFEETKNNFKSIESIFFYNYNIMCIVAVSSLIFGKEIAVQTISQHHLHHINFKNNIR